MLSATRRELSASRFTPDFSECDVRRRPIRTAIPDQRFGAGIEQVGAVGSYAARWLGARIR